MYLHCIYVQIYIARKHNFTINGNNNGTKGL